MSWKEVTRMSSKCEFVQLALTEQYAFSQLCQRYGISRKTGYALMKRYQTEGMAGLAERPRCPLHSPTKTDAATESKVIAIRQKHPHGGGRKIQAWLLQHGENKVPAISTITKIWHRHGYIETAATQQRLSRQRFEHAAPNDLWQIDFKGHFALHQGRCHPGTIVDDHARFAIALKSCNDERADTIKPLFIEVFKRYGLPWQMNFDKGTPWATMQRPNRYTAFSLWLMRLNIRMSYSRVRHPQTNGKVERFHRTLQDELGRYHHFRDVKDAQHYFDQWRRTYNFERPHEALELQPPSSRYQLSNIPHPATLPDIIYPRDDIVRHVNKAGMISYHNKKILVGESLYGLPVGLRYGGEDTDEIYFCRPKILSFNFLAC